MEITIKINASIGEITRILAACAVELAKIHDDQANGLGRDYRAKIERAVEYQEHVLNVLGGLSNGYTPHRLQGANDNDPTASRRD